MKKNSRINQYGMCLDEYEENEANRDVYYKRAVGESPEMECSKALGDMLSEYVKDNESILDVGCAVGHYYRSLKKRIKVEFTYTGVDPYKILIDKALEAWENEKNVNFKIGNIYNLPFNDKSFDYVICNNVITHIPNIRKPISELIRVANKKVVIRTPIFEISYRIQLVYNNKWWPYTNVRPGEEFDENGSPRAFSYFDIHSKDFFTSVIQDCLPDAKVKYIKDDKFDAEKINESARKERFIEPTRVIDGMQVSGCLLLPHYFVEISK